MKTAQIHQLEIRIKTVVVFLFTVTTACLLFGCFGSAEEDAECSWTKIEENVHSEIYAGWQTTDGLLYTTGGDTIWVRESGKEAVRIFAQAVSLNDIWGDINNIVYSVGIDAVTNEGIVVECQKEFCEIIQRFPNVELFSVWGWGEDKNQLVMTGRENDGGTIIATIIGYNGEQAEILHKSTDTHFKDIWCSQNGESIMAVGYYTQDEKRGVGVIVQGSSEGEWIEYEQEDRFRFNSVWGSSSSDIYVVGIYTDDWHVSEDSQSLGIVLNYNGKEWTKLSRIPLNLNFWTVWGKSAKEVYMAGAVWSKDRSQRAESYIGKWDGNELTKEILCENAYGNITNFALSNDPGGLFAFSTSSSIWRKN